MSVIDELLANNEGFAASLPDKHLDVRPSRQLAIVTCMDSRLDVFAALGLGDGEAHVLRNAGGVITDDVIRSLAISQRRLGTREVMLIHHTDCGMQKLTDDGFRTELMETTGVAPAFAIESFADVDADVRQSILRVRRSAFLPHRDSCAASSTTSTRTACARSTPRSLSTGASIRRARKATICGFLAFGRGEAGGSDQHVALEHHAGVGSRGQLFPPDDLAGFGIEGADRAFVVGREDEVVDRCGGAEGRAGEFFFPLDLAGRRVERDDFTACFVRLRSFRLPETSVIGLLTTGTKSG